MCCNDLGMKYAYGVCSYPAFFQRFVILTTLEQIPVFYQSLWLFWHIFLFVIFAIICFSVTFNWLVYIIFYDLIEKAKFCTFDLQKVHLSKRSSLFIVDFVQPHQVRIHCDYLFRIVRCPVFFDQQMLMVSHFRAYVAPIVASVECLSVILCRRRRKYSSIYAGEK